uniref:Iron-sulfur cluster repair di-iron protein n=1 Tax=uncultured microorganism TaxID=358574 RepID=F8UHL2_9ZZZZ|nr:iron-sulfur cluster repair di-iron protein [uncultured microorganism]
MNAERLAAARDLVEHVLERFHEAHRRDLPRIVALARDVEEGGGPAGFAVPFAALAEALEMHMFKEEMRLFPMMEQGGNSLIVQLIDDMQAEHRLHGDEVGHIEALLRALPAAADPGSALASLRTAWAGFLADLAEHTQIEDGRLFPMFRR